MLFKVCKLFKPPSSTFEVSRAIRPASSARTKTRSVVPTVLDLLSGSMENQSGNSQPSEKCIGGGNSPSCRQDRRGLGSVACTCRRSHRTEDISVRTNEDGVLSHRCPLGKDIEDSPDLPMLPDFDLVAMLSDSYLRDVEIPCLVAEMPSSLNGEENSDSTTRNANSPIGYSSIEQLTEGRQLVPPSRRLDEETMAAWADDFSDEDEYWGYRNPERKKLHNYELGNESDMEEFAPLISSEESSDPIDLSSAQAENGSSSPPSENDPFDPRPKPGSRTSSANIEENIETKKEHLPLEENTRYEDDSTGDDADSHAASSEEENAETMDPHSPSGKKIDYEKNSKSDATGFYDDKDGHSAGSMEEKLETWKNQLPSDKRFWTEEDSRRDTIGLPKGTDMSKKADDEITPGPGEDKSTLSLMHEYHTASVNRDEAEEKYYPQNKSTLSVEDSKSEMNGPSDDKHTLKKEDAEKAIFYAGSSTPRGDDSRLLLSDMFRINSQISSNILPNAGDLLMKEYPLSEKGIASEESSECGTTWSSDNTDPGKTAAREAVVFGAGSSISINEVELLLSEILEEVHTAIENKDLKMKEYSSPVKNTISEEDSCSDTAWLSDVTDTQKKTPEEIDAPSTPTNDESKLLLPDLLGMGVQPVASRNTDHGAKTEYSTMHKYIRFDTTSLLDNTDTLTEASEETSVFDTTRRTTEENGTRLLLWDMIGKHGASANENLKTGVDHSTPEKYTRSEEDSKSDTTSLFDSIETLLKTRDERVALDTARENTKKDEARLLSSGILKKPSESTKEDPTIKNHLPLVESTKSEEDFKRFIILLSDGTNTLKAKVTEEKATRNAASITLREGENEFSLLDTAEKHGSGLVKGKVSSEEVDMHVRNNSEDEVKKMHIRFDHHDKSTEDFHSELETTKLSKDGKRTSLTMEPVSANYPKEEETQPDLATALRFMTEFYPKKDDREFCFDALDESDEPQIELSRETPRATAGNQGIPRYHPQGLKSRSGVFEPILTDEEKASLLRRQNKITKIFKIFRKKLARKT